MIKLTEEDFKMIYDTHFDNLRRYLYYRSGDQDLSADIAQNVFMKIWKKKIDISKGNIKSLLFKMGTDEFISNYRRLKIERDYVNSQDFKLVHETNDQNDFAEKKQKFENFRERKIKDSIFCKLQPKNMDFGHIFYVVRG